jgi:2'-5' RNA ligase
MDKARLFISLPIESALAREIYKQFQNLNLPWAKIKPVATEQIHLTLKFLGDIPLEKIPELIEALAKVGKKQEIIELSLGQGLIFDEKNPRVLSLALEAHKKLTELYQEIEETLWQAKLAYKEMRRFSPHLTLARVKQKAELSEFTAFQKWSFPKTSTATRFELQESFLSKRGPDYLVLQTFDL